MGQLDGKVAIVTGSGRGIGQQVALRLARDGAAVVVNDLDDAPAKETIALIEKLGGLAVACNGDVTAKDFGERIVNTAVKQLGGLLKAVPSGIPLNNSVTLSSPPLRGLAIMEKPGGRVTVAYPMMFFE